MAGSPMHSCTDVQGMVALGALSYLLELDGQKTLAKHYNGMNEDFVAYWLQHAKVSAF